METAREFQSVWICWGDNVDELYVPASHIEVLPGVTWGLSGELFTPAFWKYQAEIQIRQNRYCTHRFGKNLLEEVAACLLGGYGIPAELGIVAFDRLNALALLDGTKSESEIFKHLSAPFEIDSKLKRYRFAKQKAAYLSSALKTLRESEIPTNEVCLRTLLMELPGIGPKTASWIIRNHCNSNEVAIVDVHLHRAGKRMKLFPANSNPIKDYFDLEKRFLEFCGAIAVPASILDALIWDYMRRIGPTSRLKIKKNAKHRYQQNMDGYQDSVAI